MDSQECQHSRGTADDFLYITERFHTNGPLKYNIPVSNGGYDVRLLFAENYVNERGKRVFDVKIEGKTAYSQLDIFQKAGGKNCKWDLTHRATVNDGRLRIGAIEIIPIINRSPTNGLLAS